MNLEDAVKAMLKTREALRSKQGIIDPNFISENMQRLTQYTSAIEEHLAEAEKELENEMHNIFIQETRAGTSVSQSETLARFKTKQLKGEIEKLSRYVKSSWAIIGVAQSRVNHLSKERQTT